MSEEKIQRLQLTKKALDDLASEIQGAQYPVSVLDDFKDSVDHARTTIWTIMKLEEERRAAREGFSFDIEQKVVELRLRRAHHLLRQVEADIGISLVGVSTPGISDFDRTVKSVNDRLIRLLRSGA